ncbi:PEP-CTERM sorting domain-containing protein [Colwellia piezophila]|uniref:PEP-CTERM sorting domain-containing protein n=1 Tax=Colwellia piezophila TaxID=211668 RepID=UPI00036ABA20|nr:PEP-CTERM sorting domain-containing protein [Colwellia piezophila]
MGLPRHKQYLYEDGVRVHFIVNWLAGDKYLQRLGKKCDNTGCLGQMSAENKNSAKGMFIEDYHNGHNTISDDSETSLSHALVRTTPQDVPEPSTFAIFALGIMGLVSRRLKKQS